MNSREHWRNAVITTPYLPTVFELSVSGRDSSEWGFAERNCGFRERGIPPYTDNRERAPPWKVEQVQLHTEGTVRFLL